MRKPLAVMSVIAFLGAILLAPGAAADTTTMVTSWQKAVAASGEGGSLWEPTFTAGLKRSGKITVVVDGVTADATTQAAKSGSMFVGAKYGKDGANFTISEKYVGTQWANDVIFDIATAEVGKTAVMMGEPGTKIKVTATISANCYVQAYTGNAPPPSDSFRCARSDVKKYGGTLVMTAEPSSTMLAPGSTDVIIQSEGITYRQLLRVAANLSQLMG